MFIETVTTAKAQLKLIEKGIIEVDIEDGITIEVEDANKFLKILRELAGNDYYGVLAIPGAFSHATPEVKKLASKELNSPLRIATAILIKNFGIQILASFFIKMNKPQTPTKTFKNRESAIKWIRKKIKEREALMPKQYRRKKTSLTWHSRPDCSRWPTKDYVEEQPKGELSQYMKCTFCKELERADEAKYSIN